jgi:exodeoxyribonuclease V alpha subunit
MELPILIEKVMFRSDKGYAALAVTLNPYSSLYKADLEDVILKKTKPNNYNNFTISTNLLNDDKKIEGGQYIAIGEFEVHKQYGGQFKADFIYPDRPTNEDGLRIYLQTLPNIKVAISADIIKTFGVEETIRILDEEPMKLTEIRYITERKIPPIKEAWDRGKGERELAMWLNKHNIPPKMCTKIYATWKEDSLKILIENPYRIAEIDGFGFDKADFIAHKIFDVVPKGLRTVAAMYSVLENNLYKNSNLCMPYGSFKDTVMAILKDNSEKNDIKNTFDTKEYQKLIPECIKTNLNKFVAIKNIKDNNHETYVYLKEIWDKEKYIASSIYHRGSELEEENDKEIDLANEVANPFHCNIKDLEDAERDMGEFSGRNFKLDDCQKEAITSVFENKITIITGGGGSGKSSICRCIYHLAQEKKLSIRMMSPTGKAAQVLTSKTTFPAQTIHRSLKLKPGSDFTTEVIKEDIVIIDEVSMVGIDTMYSVMKALEENIWAHIVFVGDCNQLPSVSPGNFLSDMMNSNCVKVVKLNKIHRQDEHSFIPLLANDIALGKVVDIPEDASDIKWHDLNSPESFETILRRKVTEFMRGNDIDDLQILAPMYKNNHGVNNINTIIQELMAEENGVKDSKEDMLTRGFTTYYVGDRVIQTSNNYQREIFNGDIGKIVKAGRKALDPSVSDEKKDYLIVNFYGEELTFVAEEIDQLKLAWCITVHRFQGSQSPYIICVISREANIMMTKEWVYTALTRASKKVDIYGHLETFKLAPTKSAVKKRYTNMNNLIRELKDNRKIFKVLE